MALARIQAELQAAGAGIVDNFHGQFFRAQINFLPITHPLVLALKIWESKVDKIVGESLWICAN